MESSPDVKKKAKTRGGTPSSSRKGTSQLLPKKRTASLHPALRPALVVNSQEPTVEAEESPKEEEAEK